MGSAIEDTPASDVAARAERPAAVAVVAHQSSAIRYRNRNGFGRSMHTNMLGTLMNAYTFIATRQGI